MSLGRLRRLLRRRIIEIAFAVSVCGLAGAGALAFYLLERTSASDQWVLHTAVVIAKLERLHSALAEAESAGRGYLLSGTDSAKARYRQVLAEAGTRHDDVRVETADNPQQQEALERIRQTIDARYDHLTAQVKMRDTQGLEAVARGPWGYGSEHMAAIKRQIDAMKAHEYQLLASRQATRREGESHLKLAMALFFATAALLLAGVFWSMKRMWRARVRAEATALRASHYDTLTSLPNHRLLLDRLGAALSRARRHQQVVAVFRIDLDDFGGINERLGRAAGDELLQFVSYRLQRLVGIHDTAARIGDDEFAIVLSGLRDPTHAQRFAARVVGSLSDPFTVGGAELTLGASVGIALFPQEADSASALLDCASAALECARGRGKRGEASVSAVGFGALDAAA